MFYVVIPSGFVVVLFQMDRIKVQFSCVKGREVYVILNCLLSTQNYFPLSAFNLQLLIEILERKVHARN